MWFYGRGRYGVPRPISPDDVLLIHRWTFDTWGEDLILGPAAPQFPAQLYYYDSSTPTEVATLIPDSPLCNGFVVTDERIVMTIGSPSEARLVQWSDREDYTNWVSDISNYAGNFFLQGTGRLISIDKVGNMILILSENDAHVGRFIGGPLVYGFDRVGDGCGPLNAASVATTSSFAMWPSRDTFWMFDGTLRQITCDVQDYLRTDMDYEFSIAAAHSLVIPDYNEIWWFYRSKSSETGDVDKYVAFDYKEGHWQVGVLDRTASVDGEAYLRPVMLDKDNNIYDHELQATPVSPPAYATTGPLELGTGEQEMAVRYIYPDTQTIGKVSYSLIGSQMPTAPEYTYGPYSHGNPVSTRAIGRQIRLRIDAEPDTVWEVGPATRFDVAPIGTGRR
jgi:hypothetical protein